LRRRLCALFGHHRDSRRAHPSIDGWRAPCRLCGARMVRVSSGRWQVLGDPEPAPRTAPVMRAARHPFADDQAGVGTRPDQGRVRGKAGRQRRESNEGDRTLRLLGALFEHPQLAEPPWEANDDRRDGPRARLQNPRSEAEMFAIAFACCREMLFRMADHFSPGSKLPAERTLRRRSIAPAAAANDGARD